MSISNNATNHETSTVDIANHSSNETKEEIEFTLDDIFVNLTLISRIEVGNKLIRNDKHVNIDTSYFPSITRWLYGQNHIDILKFINTILNKSFEYNDILTKDKNDESRQNLIRLNNILSNVINGLSNLMQTYHYDKLTQSSIEVMINTIRNKLNLQLKNIHYVYDDDPINKTNTLSSSFHGNGTNTNTNTNNNIDEVEQTENQVDTNSNKLSNSTDMSSYITKPVASTNKEHDSNSQTHNSNHSHPKKKKFHI